ncbi:XrtX-associated membrane protein [Hymenobacter cavernae]|uniref:DUF4293 family protein n=1 Tax=Hymenobacter cavernae TaxID=2044852 RepID=A0ABQ1TLH6_9BACT|nr:hypothetical protein [Hymenobacter cavernae]GGE97216.1 hypothetical protein GCM10011383_04960 [Hymenobacter cavernae]
MLSLSTFRIPAVLRYGLATGLGLLLFIAGANSEQFFPSLTSFWQHVFSSVGLAHRVGALQQGVSTQVTTRSLPAMLTYGLLYTSVCCLIMALLLNSGYRLKLVIRAYLAVFLTCILLLSIGKLGGDITWAYQLGRRLIDAVVSPLPIMVLTPTISWYAPMRKTEELSMTSKNADELGASTQSRNYHSAKNVAIAADKAALY